MNIIVSGLQITLTDLFVHIYMIAYTFILLLFVQQSYPLSEFQNMNVNHDQLNRSYKQVMYECNVYTTMKTIHTTKH